MTAEVAAAIGVTVLLLIAGLVAWVFGYARGRREALTETSVDYLAAVLYRVSVPNGRPWLLIPDALRAVFIAQATHILDELAGES